MLQEKLLDLIDELAENNREQTKVLQELSIPNGSTISVVSRFAELAGQNALLIVNAKATADEIRFLSLKKMLLETEEAHRG